MPDPIMYQGDAYVVLEPNLPEQLLTADELLAKLKDLLADQQDDLPPDLSQFTDLDTQARHLMETACEFNLDPAHYLQWFVVRLEK
ncbi:chlororespiratory reduction protein 7 [Leptolyngbya sp. NK1-12]|uniref:Chlororespiratory reduction protein 7 n=1 Tax=Leptolyngbya sp. NK1-12 TaxID=2547451 RepID=A0AA96W941_9CYAN|nr:chlororespiratory reduction protein 7 [Leptolyngbya sp. NK1-12]